LELEHPGGQAQADFGTTHVVWDRELKEIKYLAVSFPFSNAGFCVPVPAESQQCFLHALIQVFEWIGGVPQRIRFDNLSAAVVNIGKGAERELTDTFTRFMLHYRFEAEFCSPARGNEKGNEENIVGYSRRNWLLPYPQAKSFTELTQILYERAIDDLNRIHYAKGVVMAKLWQQEQQEFFPLPGIPFEPVELRTAKGDKFGKVRYEKEVYHLPSATGQPVLLKLGWDRVEILDQCQRCLGTFPRQYVLKAQPIDWKGYFEVFAQKPRGARHAAMYRFLPQAVLSYLEETEHYRERLKFISTLLTEGFAMDAISEALATTRSRSYNQALIRHLLYQLHLEKPLEKLSNIFDLTELEFINRKENILAVGAVGTGKTHLATALGIKACSQRKSVRFYRCLDLVNILLEHHRQGRLGATMAILGKSDLLIIDELGFVPLHRDGAELLFNVVAQAYEHQSVIVTSNLEFGQWNSVLGDNRLTAAMIDRLVHHAHILAFDGEITALEKHFLDRPGFCIRIETSHF
jgi:DNA replication protein DnaC